MTCAFKRLNVGKIRSSSRTAGEFPILRGWRLSYQRSGNPAERTTISGLKDFRVRLMRKVARNVIDICNDDDHDVLRIAK